MLFYAPSVFVGGASMDQRDRMMAMMGAFIVAVSAVLGTVFATGIVGGDDEGPPNLIAAWNMGGTVSSSEVGLNTQVVTFDVMDHNLTELSVRLAWTDDEIFSPLGQRADILTLDVEPPSTLDANSQTVTGSQGDLSVTFDLATIPSETDPKMFEDFDFLDATGEWTVTVSVNPQGFRDTGNDWTATLSYSFYEGQLFEAPEGN
jgi:hypothetical protein